MRGPYPTDESGELGKPSWQSHKGIYRPGRDSDSPESIAATRLLKAAPALLAALKGCVKVMDDWTLNYDEDFPEFAAAEAAIKAAEGEKP